MLPVYGGGVDVRLLLLVGPVPDAGRDGFATGLLLRLPAAEAIEDDVFLLDKNGVLDPVFQHVREKPFPVRWPHPGDHVRRRVRAQILDRQFNDLSHVCALLGLLLTPATRVGRLGALRVVFWEHLLTDEQHFLLSPTPRSLA